MMRLDDGVVTIKRIVSINPPQGSMPVPTYSDVLTEYYQNRTVGINRFWSAKAHNDQVDLLVRINRSVVSTADLAVLNPAYDTELTGTYKILQVQYVEEDGLLYTDLSLERTEGVNDPV